MKVIFDIGANKGQNLNYFLDKADIVFAFEANPFLVKKIKSDFKKFINEKKLIVRNIALVNNDNFKNIDFYIPKTKSTHSTVYPDDISKFINEALNRFGKIDVLVNSAGHGPKGPRAENVRPA
mgnify:CR=1 FL=1